MTRPDLLTGGGSLVPEADSRIALRRADQAAALELYAIRLEVVSVAVNGGWPCALGRRALASTCGNGCGQSGFAVQWTWRPYWEREPGSTPALRTRFLESLDWTRP